VSGARALVLALAGDTSLPDCQNPFADADQDPALDLPDAAERRRRNLTAYLEEAEPGGILLVGEAMGYRGGRFTGISFTSERVLRSWGAPYAPSSTTRDGWAEPSATIVHGILGELGAGHGLRLWNSVPAHPPGARGPLSNRAPTRAEVTASLPYLEAAIAVLAPRRIVAVGRTAERALGDRAEAVLRHPAQGGASAFREGARRLLAAADRR
jgi:uracil-DNA glycosylase